MRSSFLALSAAMAIGVPPAAAWAAPGEFRLPTTTASPTPSDRQGPVAADVPESRTRPAPAPTPTPSPPAAAPVPTPSASPPPEAITAPPPPPPTATAAPRPSATRQASPPVGTPPAGPTAAPLPLPAPTQAVPLPPPNTTTPDIISPSPQPAKDGGFPWWWAIGAALLAALAAAAAWWKLRHGAGPTASVKVPHIERPRVPPPAAAEPAAPASPAAPPAPPTAADPLQLALEPLRLSLTLMNASLAYRLEVSNHGTAPLQGLRIEADMISAHSSLPREQQLSGPGDGAATAHVIEHLAPGESRIVEGEFRLPFPQIVPIRQGTVTLLLPLARFRAHAPGSVPVVRTFAVGQPGGSGMQPFRLDQGPRVFPQLVQRAFG